MQFMYVRILVIILMLFLSNPLLSFTKESPSPAKSELPKTNAGPKESTEALPGLITAAEQRIALVIGNGSYDFGFLKNPVNDANDLAASLQKLGFKVTLKKNANLETMEGAIEDFGNQLKKGGVGLFYYAGHGVQVNGINYLIPVGGKINKESDVRYKAVDTGRILDEMANANNGMNILLLDACRDNPFGKSFRSASRGLAIVSNSPSGTFISYSTSPGQVASDGEGRNSPYTAAVIQYIKEPGLTISDVFMNVRSKVKKQTGQVPWELSSLEGKFYFVPGSTNTIMNKDQIKDTQEKQPETETAGGHKPPEPSSFAELKKKMEAKKQRESQVVNDFGDAKKMELESQNITERIQIWQQFKETLTDEHTTKIDEIRKYASNRIDTLERFKASGKTLPKEINTDGRFIAYDDNTVIDTKTNLMWARRDNGDKIRNQNEAKSYCENYHAGGYTDWRMPTVEELGELQDKSKSRSASCRGDNIHFATELIDITCIWIWASKLNTLVYYGDESNPQGVDKYSRALPVRFTK